MNVRDTVKKIPHEIKYILLLFVTTRFALSIIGVASRRLLARFGVYHPHWVYTKNLWLDIWGLWDTGWYLSIAERGYPPLVKAGVSNWGFFPMYSMLIKIFNIIMRNSYISGIVVSNICLVISCVFLYKLVKLYSDDSTALRSVKFLFLFPSAFILSAAFAESLFLTSLIICFYYAKRERWLLAGIAGFIAALTRPFGVFAVLPLFYEYYKSKQFRLSAIKPDILSLLLVPFGPFVFAMFGYFRTGDFFAHVYAKQSGWMIRMGNPFEALWLSLQSHNDTLIFNSLFILVVAVILTIFFRKIGFSYWLLGMLIILISLMGARNITPVAGTMTGMMRYATGIFPLYIIFAKLGENKYTDQALTCFLALMQGFLMVFWSAGFKLII